MVPPSPNTPDSPSTPRGRRAVALAAGFGLLVSVLLFLLVEGVASVSSGRDAAPSLLFRAVERVHPSDPMRRFTAPEPMLTDAAELEPLLPAFRAYGVGMGNSPYEELKTDEASINATVDGCLELRPNLAKRMSFLRTPLFERFNPLTVFFDADREKLPPELRQFLDRYAVRWISAHTNEYGERSTFPPSEAADVVLVAGDSVVFGVMLEDDETLSSLLQARDANRRYVNLGIGGADAPDILCALRRAGERYTGRIRGLVYVYCENDFEEDEPFGAPEDVVEAIRDYSAQQEIEDVTVVYMPYIFNVVPELTRIRGERGGRWPDRARERARLARAVAKSRFGWVDFTDIALREARSLESRFGALSLYVDVVHLSPIGAERMADAVAATSSGHPKRALSAPPISR